MTYQQAQEIIDEKLYTPNSETLVQKMIYCGTSSFYKYADFEYFRKWEDKISEADKKALNQHYSKYGLTF